MCGPKPNMGQIGLAVLTFTNKYSDRQTKYIYIDVDVDVEKEKTRPTEKSEHGTALISISLYLSL